MANQLDTGSKRQTITLRTKIFLGFICGLLVFVALLYMLVLYTENEIKQVYYEQTIDHLEMQGEMLSEQLSMLQGSIAVLCINTTFNDKLESYLRSSSKTATFQETTYFSETLEELLSAHQMVKHAFLCTPKGTFYTLPHEALRKYDPLENEEIQALISQPGNTMYRWGIRMENPVYAIPGNVIPLIVSYRQRVLSQPIQLVLLLDEAFLYQKINHQGSSSDNVILNTNGDLIVASTNAQVMSMLTSDSWLATQTQHKDELWEVSYNGNSLFAISNSIAGNMRWFLLGITNKESLLAPISIFKNTTVIIISGLFIVYFLLALTIARSITKPLHRLRDTMKRVTHREFDAVFVYQYNDVVGDLGDSFNCMIMEIKNLIIMLEEEREQARIQQLLKRRAELKALQAQINPHFLYNTLDSINWMALDTGADEISEIVVALAALFRSGLKRGNELSPLFDEITHVSSYLTIQKMRYQERFDYELDIPEDIKQFYCIRLLLQPLVENSIYHGIKPSYQKGFIRICAKSEKTLIHLLVLDNGLGIEQSRMEEINQKLKDYVIVDKAGYGIFNVNERIHLYFGDGYGLQYRRENQWTIAEITIPRITQEEVKQHVQYFNS